jgi:hypothetical protein
MGRQASAAFFERKAAKKRLLHAVCGDEDANAQGKLKFFLLLSCSQKRRPSLPDLA